METKKGDMFRSILDGAELIVKRIVYSMVVLESQDGKRQILTGIGTLNNKTFYRKKGGYEG